MKYIYIDDDNGTWLSIVSILISICSVSSKTLVFSRSIDYTTFIFNWLCAVTDFFGVFFAVSWVFLNIPHTNNNNNHNNNNNIGNWFNNLTIIAQIWIVKVTIC